MICRKSYQWLLILIFFIGLGCSNPEKEKSTSSTKTQKEATQQENTKSYIRFIPSIVKVESFDKDRFLETETAFLLKKILLFADFQS